MNDDGNRPQVNLQSDDCELDGCEPAVKMARQQRLSLELPGRDKAL